MRAGVPCWIHLSYSAVPSQFDKNGLIVGQNDPRSNGIPVNRYNNVDNFYVKGKTQSHHVSVYGNTEKAGYYFSAGRLYQTGVIPTDGLIVPGNFNISNASTSTSFNQTIRRRLVAGYADIRLDYRNWLFVELTGRNEWTSTLAK